MSKEEIIAAIKELPVPEQKEVLRAARRAIDAASDRRIRAAAERMKDYYANDPEVKEWLDLDMEDWPLEYPTGRRVAGESGADSRSGNP